MQGSTYPKCILLVSKLKLKITESRSKDLLLKVYDY
jgi:hypothetical protein